MSRARVVLGLAAAVLVGAVAGYRAGFAEGTEFGRVDGIVWSMGQLVGSRVPR